MRHVQRYTGNSPSTYDYNGNLTQILQPGGTTTTTVYLANTEEVATTGSTTTTTTYYYAGPIRVALAVNGVFSYLGADVLGSADMALDASGNAQASTLYGPYGGTRYTSGTMPTDYGFTGQHSDSATGLDYYGARYYDPLGHQFTSADTALPQSGYNPWGLSRYAYVHGNSEALTGSFLYRGSGAGIEQQVTRRGVAPIVPPSPPTCGQDSPRLTHLRHATASHAWHHQNARSILSVAERAWLVTARAIRAHPRTPTSRESGASCLHAPLTSTWPSLRRVRPRRPHDLRHLAAWLGACRPLIFPHSSPAIGKACRSLREPQCAPALRTPGRSLRIPANTCGILWHA